MSEADAIARGSRSVSKRRGQERKALRAPLGAAPPKPDDLTPEASAEWDRLVPILIVLGTLGVGDGLNLRRYIELGLEYREVYAITRLPTHERVLFSDKGAASLNPLQVLRATLGRELMTHEREFGLTPNSRRSLGIALTPVITTTEPVKRGNRSGKAGADGNVIDAGDRFFGDAD